MYNTHFLFNNIIRIVRKRNFVLPGLPSNVVIAQNCKKPAL